MLRKIASIKEKDCIGCNKCMQICPVDAILGTFNKLHYILIDICIGCQLCIEICPTNCIKMKDRLLVNYIIKKYTISSAKIKLNDIHKKKFMQDSKSRYKNKILRIKKENLKNLLFYKNKKINFINIRDELKNIIKKKLNT